LSTSPFLVFSSIFPKSSSRCTITAFFREVSMAEKTSAEIERHASTWSIVWGLLLIVAGMLAISAPFLAALAVNGIIAWLIVFSGVVHLILAFHSHGARTILWKLLVGFAYLWFGGYLILHPGIGVASLTLILASLFMIEGILNVVLFFKMRSLQGSSWMLVDGVITLLLGLMIYAQWPSSSAWAIGILVGVSLIMSGVSRIMLSLAVRKMSGTGTGTIAAAA
jgi:uncharacterized membrane protein HdeD (DUF308 family)